YALLGYGIFLLGFLILYPMLVSTFSQNAPLFADHLYMIPFMVLGFTAFRVLNSLSQSLLKSVVPNFAQQIFLRLGVTICLLLYWPNLIGLEAMLWGIVASYLVSALVVLVYLLWLDKFPFSLETSLWGTKAFKVMAIFAIYAILSDLVLVLVNKLDIAMLASLVGEEYAGVYSNAFYLALLVAIPYRALGAVLNPLFARKAREKSYEEIQTLYRKAALNNLLLSGLVMVGIWANLDNYYRITPNLAQYIGGKSAVALLSIGILVNVFIGPQRAIIINTRYFRFDLYSNLIVLSLVCLGNYLLIPRYFETGAAITTASGLILYNLIGMMYLWRKLGIHPFQWALVKILVLIGFCLGVGLSIPPLENVYLDILLRSGAILIPYLGASYFFRLSEDASEMLDQAIKKLRLKR
ncbi:MAG: polysaccharide biosynthesis C-terminal domain-containing protein, partial [Bacteroidota bacterium]